MEVTHVLGLFLLAVCASTVSAIPNKNRREELAHLANILGKIRTLERVRQNAGSTKWESSSSDNEDATDTDTAAVAQDALGRRPTGFAKRQGDWSYDYGLGGGRFGKRANYGDYGIGGGRFGRDVDHVDPALDGNDGESMS